MPQMNSVYSEAHLKGWSNTQWENIKDWTEDNKNKDVNYKYVYF